MLGTGQWAGQGSREERPAGVVVREASCRRQQGLEGEKRVTAKKMLGIWRLLSWAGPGTILCLPTPGRPFKSHHMYHQAHRDTRPRLAVYALWGCHLTGKKVQPGAWVGEGEAEWGLQLYRETHGTTDKHANIHTCMFTWTWEDQTSKHRHRETHTCIGIIDIHTDIHTDTHSTPGRHI